MTRLQFTILYLITMLLVPKICFSSIFVLNDKVIGSDVSGEYSLIEKFNNDNKKIIYPNKVEVFLEKDKYFSAVVYYSSNKISFGELESTINTMYPNTQSKKVILDNLKVWHVIDKNFAISLLINEPCDEESSDGDILVTYKIFSQFDN